MRTNTISAEKANSMVGNAGLFGVRLILAIAMLIATVSIGFLLMPQDAMATGSISTCDGCHGYSNAFTDSGSRDGLAGTFPGSHNKHAVVYQKACTVCHSDNTGNYAHRDGTVNINATISGGAYSKASFSQTNTGTLGKCSSTTCHFNGVATYSTPTWGLTSSGQCGTCHGVVNTSVPTSANHATHVGQAAGYQFACSKCHSTVAAAQTDSTVQTTITSTTLHVNGAKNVAFDSFNGTGNFNTPAAQDCSTLYCHSNGTALAGAGTPYVQANWGLGAQNCNMCHGSAASTTGKPDYASGSPKANSHTVHLPWNTMVSCQACHYATTTDGTNITTKANHVNKAYNVSAYGAGGVWSTLISFTPGAQTDGITCAANQCHAGQTPKWGSIGYGTATLGGDWNCISCHSYSFPKRLGGSIATIRKVIGSGGDFNMTALTSGSRHLYNATTIVKWDCIVCHREGVANAANGVVGNTAGAYHNDYSGLVNLRNVDTTNESVGWSVNNVNWTPADYANIDNFCLGCHDSNGASAVSVAANNSGLGGTALRPFNSTDNAGAGFLGGSTVIPGAVRTGVTDVKTQFAVANPSQHAVLGARYSTKNAQWNTLNGIAWGSILLKKMNTNLRSVGETAILSCADCHVLDSGSGAHGGPSWYNLDNSGNTYYAKNNGSTDALCFKCHNFSTYQLSSVATLGWSAGAMSASRFPHSSDRIGGRAGIALWGTGASTLSNAKCLQCHGGFDGLTTVTKRSSYGGIHGTWGTYALAAGSTAGTAQTKYRFLPGTYMKSGSNPTTSGAFTCYFWSASGNGGKYATCSQHDNLSTTGFSTTYGRPTSY